MSFGRTASATSSISSSTLTGFAVAADAHVGRGSVLVFTRRKAAWWPPTASGSPFIRNRRTSPSLGLGQDLLGDDVAVAAERLDHLVEVGRLVVGHEEHAGAPEPCSGFSTAPPSSSTKAASSLGSREISVRGRTVSGKCWK